MTMLKTKGVTTGNEDLQNATILSKTALNKLNAQIPELSKFVVAFKDLSQELPEDTGMQVGMIILNIKGRYVYVPVVSKAGQVQVFESMFDASTKTFSPITRKYVKWMIEKGHLLGEAERIPSTVAKDPNLYDAIVPPKTGKYVYASEGRLGGFFASMPSHIKQAALEVITNDFAFQQAMAPVMSFDIIKDHLECCGEPVDAEIEPTPEVITSAEGLTEEQIQEILSKGYLVKNPPKSKRVAVESSSGEGLSLLRSIMPGTAMSVMRKSDGQWLSVASLRMVPGSDNSITCVSEDGKVVTNGRAVTDNTEVDYNALIERLDSKPAVDVDMGEYGMIFTGFSWMGPLKVHNVVSTNGWTSLTTSIGPVRIHPSIRTFYDKTGDTVVLSTGAMFYSLSSDVEPLEEDLGVAKYMNDIHLTKMLDVQATLMHRNGVYAVDGKDIGSKPAIISYLLKSWGIDVPTAETLTQSAEKKEKILVKMASVRGSGHKGSETNTKPSPMYEHGDKPLMGMDSISGDARQRALGMASSGKAVKDLKDREVMEATLISEMLQNPDLAGSIKEYLPEIRVAVDKLGRTLFLMRLNTNKLNDSIDAEALNNLFTSTRNAYRILGENCVALENLSSNELG